MIDKEFQKIKNKFLKISEGINFDKIKETKDQFVSLTKQVKKEILPSDNNIILPRIFKYVDYYKIEIPGYSDKNVSCEIKSGEVYVYFSLDSDNLFPVVYDNFKLPMLDDSKELSYIVYNGLLIIFRIGGDK